MKLNSQPAISLRTGRGQSSPAGRVSRWVALCAFFCICASLALADDQLHTRPRYRLHPGDVIALSYRYTPDFDQTVTIEPDGYVTLNLVGSLKLADLTMDEARDLILKKAGERLNAPELNLVLKEFQQPSVVVAGEVQKPGKFPMQEGLTAMQAIMLSGGFMEDARSGQVILFRRIDGTTAEVKILKLNRFKNRMDLEHDLALLPGDMILVPRDKISIISRYMKLANVGMYLNPLQSLP
jgi:polysaccharide export outer membrane protein